MKLNWRQVAAWRARRHFLDRRAPAGSLLQVAGRLCGLHSQVLSSAELTAWARVEKLERGAVARALWEERTLVKTWAMRGTLHLLPTAELPVWHAALGTSTRYLREKAWQNYFGITLAELERVTEAIAEALHGRILTREELRDEVERITGTGAFRSAFSESSWGVILKPAAFSGRLCFGPSDVTGKNHLVRFTLPGTWLPPAAKVDPTAATAAITKQYLAAYGPATYQDLMRWWGGAGITGKGWMAALGGELAPVDVEGTQAWMLAGDVEDARQPGATRNVRLLPGFDQYVVAASFRAENLMKGGARRLVYRPQGWISPVLLVNGLMQGTWRHELKGSEVAVSIEPFVETPAWARLAAEREAGRLAKFFDRRLNLTWKK